MKIECNKTEWSIIEEILMSKYSISTVFNHPEFICTVWDGNYVIMEIIGTLED
jgi:hypothetical protein